MRHMLDTIGGLYQLARLAIITGFRFNGPYWTWRKHTAFGHTPPTGAAGRHAVLEYARWVHRTRRSRQG